MRGKDDALGLLDQAAAMLAEALASTDEVVGYAPDGWPEWRTTMTDAPAAEQTTRAPRPGGVGYPRRRPTGVPAETFARWCEEEQFAQLIDFACSASAHIPVELRRRGRHLVVAGERFEFPTPADARRARRRARRAGYDRRRPARSLSRAHRRLRAQQNDLYWWAIEFTGDTPF